MFKFKRCKHVLFFPLVVFLFLLFLWIIYFFRSDWEVEARKYLSNRYDFDVNILSSKKDGGCTIINCCTKDSNSINFQVSCWWGGLSTPWGDILIIPERKFKDNFTDSINNFVMNGGVIEGASIDEIVFQIRNNYSELKNVYVYYNLVWQNPSCKYYFTYMEKVYNVYYSGERGSLLKDRMIRRIEEKI